MRLELDGYEPVEREVEVQPDQQAVLFLSMTKTMSEGPPAVPVALAAEPEPGQGSPPLTPEESSASSAEPEKNNHNRAARAMGGVSTALAVLFGAGSGVCYYLANKWAQEFAEYRDEYNNTVDDAESQGSTAELAESGNRTWEEMGQKKDSAEEMQKLGLGEAIGAGVFTALAVVLFIVGRDKDESAETPMTVSAAPGGLAVEF